MNILPKWVKGKDICNLTLVTLSPVIHFTPFQRRIFSLVISGLPNGAYGHAEKAIVPFKISIALELI